MKYIIFFFHLECNKDLEYINVFNLTLLNPNNKTIHIKKINCCGIYSIRNIIIDELLINRYAYIRDNNDIVIRNNTINKMKIEYYDYDDDSDDDYDDNKDYHYYNNILITDSTIEELTIINYKINHFCNNNIIIINSNIKKLYFNNCIVNYQENYELEIFQKNKYAINIKKSNIEELYFCNCNSNYSIDNYINVNKSKIKYFYISNYYNTEKSFNIKNCNIDELKIRYDNTNKILDDMNINNNQINRIKINHINYNLNISDKLNNSINLIKLNNNINIIKNNYSFRNKFNLCKDFKYDIINNSFNLEKILNNKKILIKHNTDEINKEKYTYFKINDYKIYFNNEEVILIY